MKRKYRLILRSMQHALKISRQLRRFLSASKIACSITVNTSNGDTVSVRFPWLGYSGILQSLPWDGRFWFDFFVSFMVGRDGTKRTMRDTGVRAAKLAGRFGKKTSTGSERNRKRGDAYILRSRAQAGDNFRVWSGGSAAATSISVTAHRLHSLSSLVSLFLVWKFRGNKGPFSSDSF